MDTTSQSKRSKSKTNSNTSSRNRKRKSKDNRRNRHHPGVQPPIPNEQLEHGQLEKNNKTMALMNFIKRKKVNPFNTYTPFYDNALKLAMIGKEMISSDVVETILHHASNTSQIMLIRKKEGVIHPIEIDIKTKEIETIRNDFDGIIGFTLDNETIRHQLGHYSVGIELNSHSNIINIFFYCDNSVETSMTDHYGSIQFSGNETVMSQQECLNFYSDKWHTLIELQIKTIYMLHYLLLEQTIRKDVLDKLKFISRQDFKNVEINIFGYYLGGVIANLLAFELREIYNTNLIPDILRLELNINVITLDCPKFIRNDETGDRTLSEFNKRNVNNIRFVTDQSLKILDSTISNLIVPGFLAILQSSSTSKELRNAETLQTFKTLITTDAIFNELHIERYDKRTQSYFEIGNVSQKQEISNFVLYKYIHKIVGIFDTSKSNIYLGFYILSLFKPTCQGRLMSFIIKEHFQYMFCLGIDVKEQTLMLKEYHLHHYVSLMSSLSSSQNSSSQLSKVDYHDTIQLTEGKIKNEYMDKLLILVKDHTIYLFIGDLEDESSHHESILRYVNDFYTTYKKRTTHPCHRVIGFGFKTGGRALTECNAIFKDIDRKQRIYFTLNTKYPTDYTNVRKRLYLQFHFNEKNEEYTDIRDELMPFYTLHLRIKGIDYRTLFQQATGQDNLPNFGFVGVIDLDANATTDLDIDTFLSQGMGLLSNALELKATPDPDKAEATSTFMNFITDIGSEELDKLVKASNMGNVQKMISVSNDILSNLPAYQSLQETVKNKISSVIQDHMSNTVASAIPFANLAIYALKLIYLLEQQYIFKLKSDKQRQTLEYMTANCNIVDLIYIAGDNDAIFVKEIDNILNTTIVDKIKKRNTSYVNMMLTYGAFGSWFMLPLVMIRNLVNQPRFTGGQRTKKRSRKN